MAAFELNNKYQTLLRAAEIAKSKDGAALLRHHMSVHKSMLQILAGHRRSGFFGPKKPKVPEMFAKRKGQRSGGMSYVGDTPNFTDTSSANLPISAFD